MKKRVLLCFLSLIILPCLITSESYSQEKEGPLIVHFAYAQPKIRQGEVWRIYVSITDPDARMFRIVGAIEQPGSHYQPTTIYLKKGMEKKLSGFFAFHTTSARDLSGEELTLHLTILDREGNERKTLSFPLEFNGERMKPLPPDMEKDLNQRIGIIDVDFGIDD